jgi:hypothetical protein
MGSKVLARHDHRRIPEHVDRGWCCVHGYKPLRGFEANEVHQVNILGGIQYRGVVYFAVVVVLSMEYVVTSLSLRPCTRFSPTCEAGPSRAFTKGKPFPEMLATTEARRRGMRALAPCLDLGLRATRGSPGESGSRSNPAGQNANTKPHGINLLNTQKLT